MKHLLIALPLFFGSCKAVDGFLGVGAAGEPDRTEETISAIESAARGPADLLLPGVGGVLVTLLGLGARKYVKGRKSAPPA